MPNKRFVGIALASVSLTAAGCGDDTAKNATTSPAASTPASAAATTPSGLDTAGGSDATSSTAYRAAVVKATNAWLASLTAEQRDTATYDFDDTEAKQQWSNFPAFFKPRTGVSYNDMSDASDQAALGVAKAMLSAQGYAQYQGIREADNSLGATDSGGGPGGGGGNAGASSGGSTGNANFGDGNFYVSVFGTPSATGAFMVSLNGHHSSYNITFGDRLASSPEFVGVEPSSFQVDGHTEEPMKDEAAAIFGMLPELPSSAKLSGSFDDVMVGPQKDGQFPSKQEGTKVSDLPADVQQKVTDLITAYVGDAPAAIAKTTIADYVKQYGETYVSYAGSTKDEPGTYIRLDGPRVWIELAVQTTDKGKSHYHSVYRDKLHDYGS